MCSSTAYSSFSSSSLSIVLGLRLLPRLQLRAHAHFISDVHLLTVSGLHMNQGSGRHVDGQLRRRRLDAVMLCCSI